MALIRGRFPKTAELFLTALLFVVLPFFDTGRLMFSNQSEKFFLFFIVLFIILTTRIITSSFEKNRATVHLTKIDICLALYFIYLVLNRLFIAKNTGHSLLFFELTGIAVFYVIFRSMQAKNIFPLLLSIIVAGCAQALYGLLQLYGVFPSHHNLFKVTGGFFNPGPYAGYLACVFTLALAVWLNRPAKNYPRQTDYQVKNRVFYIIKRLNIKYTADESQLERIFTRYLPLVAMIAILVILPALSSRASWLALFAASVFLSLNQNRIRLYINQHINNRAKKIGLFFTVLVLSTAMVWGLYSYNQASADGRVLIWKASTEIIKEKPVFGAGYEKFPAHYLNAQAAYFEKNPASDYIMVADDTLYAFNEYLRIAAETGFTGLAIALLVIFLVLFAKTDSSDNHGKTIVIIARSGVLALLVFAFFSYPAEILPIKLVFAFLLAIISSHTKQVLIFSTNRVYRYVINFVAAALIMISIPFFARWYNSFKIWGSAHAYYTRGLYEVSVNYFDKALPMQKYNGLFLVSYGKALSMAKRHEEAVKILAYARDYLSNSILFTALGDSYKALGEFRKAEKAYIHAKNMLPGRFYPRYLLAKLYAEWGKNDKALEVANEILTMEVKVPSTAVDEIKEEMRQLTGQKQ